MAEKISRERAVELLKQSESGTLILAEVEPVPSLGDVPVEDQEVTIEINTYRFGEIDDAVAH